LAGARVRGRGGAGQRAIAYARSALAADLERAVAPAIGETKSKVNRKFRFLGAGDAEIHASSCILRTEGNSAFGIEWNQRNAELFTCSVEGQQPEQYLLEVALPAFPQGGVRFGGFSMSVAPNTAPAELQAVLRARMVYAGATYEARPTGFEDDSGFRRFERIVKGYQITRNGQPVGGVTFDTRNSNRLTMTAPARAEDGRDAVLFMALQLADMPDIYSSEVRDALR
jgi:hypothetical protein